MSGAVAPSPAVESARTPSHRRTSSAYNVQGGSKAEAASWSAIANVEERGGVRASQRALPEPATILLFSSRRRRRRAHYESSLVKTNKVKRPHSFWLSEFVFCCLPWRGATAAHPRPERAARLLTHGWLTHSGLPLEDAIERECSLGGRRSAQTGRRSSH